MKLKPRCDKCNTDIEAIWTPLSLCPNCGKYTRAMVCTAYVDETGRIRIHFLDKENYDKIECPVCGDNLMSYD